MRVEIQQYQYQNKNKLTSSSPLSGGDSVYDKLALVSTSFLDKLCTLTSFPCNRPRYPLVLSSSSERISDNIWVFSLSFFRNCAESSTSDMLWRPVLWRSGHRLAHAVSPTSQQRRVLCFSFRCVPSHLRSLLPLRFFISSCTVDTCYFLLYLPLLRLQHKSPEKYYHFLLLSPKKRCIDLSFF